MPFGLKNAPGTFQRFMDGIISTVFCQYALVYLDDVIVYSGSSEQHLQHVSNVLQLSKYAEVTLKLKQCHLFNDNVDYLGHVIRTGNF